MASRTYSSFVAYPATPHDLAQPITAAAERLRAQGSADITAWPQLDIFGANIPDEVRIAVEKADIVFADVTRPNLNVYYEIGYGVGLGKTFAPIVNTSFANAFNSLRSLGLFSNVGYGTYENTNELEAVLVSTPLSPLLEMYAKDINYSQPIYFLDTLHKTNFRNAIISAIKTSRSHYRSFDPIESQRISVVQLIAEITSASGIVLPYLAAHVGDAERHNLRAAFIAGLARGIGRDVIILTDQIEDNVPADYSDDILIIPKQADIEDRIIAFCSNAVLAAQEIPAVSVSAARSVLQNLTLGASNAENEFRDLRSYFVETSEYLRAARGEVKVITGRKGSGKSAIFFQVRDNSRRHKGSVVIDLKPDSHQLSSFREQILSTGDVGVFEHTIAAFWYFVCVSEILLAIYRRFEATSRFDGRALAPMRDIEDVFSEYQILQPGDFTTRLNRLSSIISRELRNAAKGGRALSISQVTNMVFKTGISKIRDLIVDHSSSRLPITFLFDNIDKGWPATGVQSGDITIVRLLIEALDRVRSDFASRDREFISIVFVRHDVYDLVLNQTPDRGKSGQVSIDWTDRAKLFQVIYRRLQAGLSDRNGSLPELWNRVFPQKVGNRDAFDYVADHALMRPRFLIDILEGSIANAINRGRRTVESDDLVDAVKQHSLSLVDDFGFEMRDVSGLANDLLYHLIGCTQTGERSYFASKFSAGGLTSDQANQAVDLMLWYGLLGVIDRDGAERYIYDYLYNTRRLHAEISQGDGEAILVMNPALYVGLSS